MRSSPHDGGFGWVVASSVITRSGSTYSTAGSRFTSARAFASSVAENPLSARENSRWTLPPRWRAFRLAASPPACSLSTTMYWPSISWAATALDGTAPTTSALATSASETHCDAARSSPFATGLPTRYTPCRRAM